MSEKRSNCMPDDSRKWKRRSDPKRAALAGRAYRQALAQGQTGWTNAAVAAGAAYAQAVLQAAAQRQDVLLAAGADWQQEMAQAKQVIAVAPNFDYPRPQQGEGDSAALIPPSWLISLTILRTRVGQIRRGRSCDRLAGLAACPSPPWRPQKPQFPR